MSQSPVLLPGATIGIFGGGQLGRLTAMAARTMGYRIHVLDPDPGCPARFVVDQCVEAAWDDAREAARLARGCDVITLEIEQISLASMNAAGSFAPVRPSEGLLAIIQDRVEQKNWLARNGFPVGPYRAVRSLDELREAITALGGRCFCKSATGGYDGRGQGKVGFKSNPNSSGAPFMERSDMSGEVSDTELHGAWEALGSGPGIVEQAIDLDREISVLVARSPRGEVKVYPAAWNYHENQILAWSVLPAPLPEKLATEARELASSIADTLSLEGILAVEMFVTKDGRLLVNELAPRPHNSYHASERACVTSQFEQLVRAVCNLPLGSPDVVQPCAIANLLGEVWLQPADSSPNSPGAPFIERSEMSGNVDSSGAPSHAQYEVGGVAAGFSPRLSSPFKGGALAGCPTSLGDVGSGKPTPRTPHFDRALAVPGVRLHLYEKLRPRKGRKMGHLSAVGSTPEEAVNLVLRAQSLL
ncbi:MAG TPA: 5-(carboxyamino)imidazole ribonucleotide synthase [Acidobacteriaceae bacterium]|nr:5-(carboxyamino)imidazole ribonucleotide synthase [Acidobacteriaceae bacterium]